jgi:oligopeptide transport system ATP-binding protein
MEKKDVILSVRNLDVSFKTTAGDIHALRGVDFDVPRGKTIAIVGDPLRKNPSPSRRQSAFSTATAASTPVRRIQLRPRKRRSDRPRPAQLPQKEMRTIINGKRIAMVFQTL